jgi:excisionase family DNA binding protein
VSPSRPVVAPALMTKTEAAAYLKISRRTVDRIADAGDIAYVLIGRSRKFEQAALDAYIAANRQPVRPEASARRIRSA